MLESDISELSIFFSTVSLKEYHILVGMRTVEDSIILLLFFIETSWNLNLWVPSVDLAQAKAKIWFWS